MITIEAMKLAVRYALILSLIVFPMLCSESVASETREPGPIAAIHFPYDQPQGQPPILASPAARVCSNRGQIRA